MHALHAAMHACIAAPVTFLPLLFSCYSYFLSYNWPQSVKYMETKKALFLELFDHCKLTYPELNILSRGTKQCEHPGLT